MSYLDEDVPDGGLYFRIDLPAEIYHGFVGNIERPAQLLQGIAQAVIDAQVRTIMEGGRDEWVPLTQSTVQRNREQGNPQPTYPLLGDGSKILRRFAELTPFLSVRQQQDQTLLTITFGPGPGEDQNPSEWIRDLLYGSPATGPEAASYGERGVIPARGFPLDAAVRATIAEELTRFVMPVAPTPAHATAFQTAIRAGLDLSDKDYLTERLPNAGQLPPAKVAANYLYEGLERPDLE